MQPTSVGTIAKLLLTVEEAAEALSLSRHTFYELVMTNKVKTIKICRSRRVACLCWSN